MRQGLFAIAAFLFLIGPIQAEDKIVLPEHATGGLLIYAHGYRPEGFPNPAILDVGEAYAALSKKGWILAATSYPKAGMVVMDGAADIDRLRDEIERKYGPIRLCVLHGESMGGTIVTLLAERDPKRYQAALAVGAALEIVPKDVTLYGPKIPLLFLSNQSELAGPEAYVRQFRTSETNLAVWKIARDGHVNVNQAEVLTALQAIIPDANYKKITDSDGTVILAERPSTSKVNPQGMEVNILAIDPVYGNFTVGALAGDLAKLGYQRGDTFPISYEGQTREVFYGKEYSDVPEGHWIAFETADGDLRISMNFRNAANDLGVKAGGKLLVRKKSP